MQGVLEVGVVAEGGAPPALAVLLNGLAMCLLSLVLLRRFAGAWLRASWPKEALPPGPWTTAHLIMVVLLGVFTQYLGFQLLDLYAKSRGLQISDLNAGIVLLTSAFWQGALVVLLVLIARASDQGFSSLGLQRAGLRPILVGLGIYLLGLPGLVGSITLWGQALDYAGLGEEVQLVQQLIMRTRGWEVGLSVLLAVVVIPFLEEVIFRGWLQGWISYRLSPVHGIVISAALFALLHGSAVLLPIFVLAILLGVVRHTTGRLAPVWAMHALHNGIQMYLLFNLPPALG